MTLSTIQLIETLRIEPGHKIPLLPWHRRRLEASCAALGYQYPGARLFEEISRQADGLDANTSHRLRVLVSIDGRYSLEFGRLPPTPSTVNLRVHPEPLQADHAWLVHKTTNRRWYDAARDWLLAHPDYFDIVYFNHKDQICEGSRSNVYIRDDSSAWLTPPVSCGLLPGTQRQELIDRGLVREAVISRRDFSDAPAIRVSNALRGWLDAALPTEPKEQ